MLFNSLQFAFFFVIVYSLYLCASHKWQNRMLLVASYVFYGFWDWRFLSLIAISTILDYYLALRIESSLEESKRRNFLLITVVANLTMLGFFKYFNFFADNLRSLFSMVGWQTDLLTLNVILPVGISFYTFQTMSYTIDVYRREIRAARNFWDYALYVAYFPQLVAGPIERAGNLLPQILLPRKVTWQKIESGAVLVGWGLFQKMIVADNMARIVNEVFASPVAANGLHVGLATYAFAFQIFADFSGYSDMARGLARMMGIELRLNFNLPYFAKNMREFWQRWHISLSTWLRDYLYIPLGGNRGSSWRTSFNLMLTMILGGLWHGAAWTFVLWGAFHGLLLGIHRFLASTASQVRVVANSRLSWLTKGAGIFFTFHLVCVGWILFRAESFGQVISFLGALISHWVFDWKADEYFRSLCFFAFPLLLVHVCQLRVRNLNLYHRLPSLAKAGLAAVLLSVLTISTSVGLPMPREFIYFQF